MVKTVVIAGCGFGAIDTALMLKKKLKDDVRVVAIDRKKHHTYYGAVFEILSQDYIPRDLHTYLVDLFSRHGVEFYINEITGLDPETNTIYTNKHQFTYDYLVLNLGSQTNYFDIKGKEFCLNVKSAGDAELLMQQTREKLEYFLTDGDFQDPSHAHFVMVGAGLTGIEVICELKYFLDREVKKYGVPADKIKLTIVESQPSVMPLFNEKSQVRAEKILKKMGINLVLGKTVTTVTEKEVILDDGHRISSGTTMWAAGVKASALCEKLPLEKNPRNEIVVNNFLEELHHPNIFACGDCASFYDHNINQQAPKLAVISLEQGAHIANNIVRIIKGQDPLEYKLKNDYLVVVHFGGKNALYIHKNIVFEGALAYWIKRHLGEKYLKQYH